MDAVRALEPFFGEFLYTHVDLEGLMQGTDMAAIETIARATSRKVTAAGGITTQDEIDRLDALGIDAVVGMALYTGRLKIRGNERGRGSSRLSLHYEIHDRRAPPGPDGRARQRRAKETETIDRTVPIGANGQLKLKNFSGDVRITGTSGTDVVVHAAARRNAKRSITSSSRSPRPAPRCHRSEQTRRELA